MSSPQIHWLYLLFICNQHSVLFCNHWSALKTRSKWQPGKHSPTLLTVSKVICHSHSLTSLSTWISLGECIHIKTRTDVLISDIVRKGFCSKVVNDFCHQFMVTNCRGNNTTKKWRILCFWTVWFALIAYSYKWGSLRCFTATLTDSMGDGVLFLSVRHTRHVPFSLSVALTAI